MWTEKTVSRPTVLKGFSEIKTPALESDEGTMLVFDGIGPEMRLIFEYIDGPLKLDVSCMDSERPLFNGGRSIDVYLTHAIRIYRIKNASITIAEKKINKIKEELSEALLIWRVMTQPGQLPVTDIAFV